MGYKIHLALQFAESLHDCLRVIDLVDDSCLACGLIIIFSSILLMNLEYPLTDSYFAFKNLQIIKCKEHVSTANILEVHHHWLEFFPD